MAEIVKGQANFPQLATHGNYRDVAPREMGKIYSRSVEHHQLSVSNIPNMHSVQTKYRSLSKTTNRSFRGENV